jgi:hypothetical protein
MNAHRSVVGSQLLKQSFFSCCFLFFFLLFVFVLSEGFFVKNENSFLTNTPQELNSKKYFEKNSNGKLNDMMENEKNYIFLFIIFIALPCIDFFVSSLNLFIFFFVKRTFNLKSLHLIIKLIKNKLVEVRGNFPNFFIIKFLTNFQSFSVFP